MTSLSVKLFLVDGKKRVRRILGKNNFGVCVYLKEGVLPVPRFDVRATESYIFSA
jgi:hypothetical protein